MRKSFVLISVFVLIFISFLIAFVSPNYKWLYIPVIPIVFLGVYDMLQRERSIIRNFPVVGRIRYIMEFLRPKIQQYFIESNTNGTPINRLNRSLVYHRSKRELDSTPFGTQKEVYEEGYEWTSHSITPLEVKDLNHHPKVEFGNFLCKQKYESSILNISAMSFGSLSSRAIEALNAGAKEGDFAHNTGEGGISPYHLKHGGDLIWQIGTGYFGCRDNEGNFSDKLFEERANQPSVKMIELKLSQGAKPGHGGILPGKKVTEEIAQIRNVKVGETVYSPPYHTAFSSNEELLKFISKLRNLSKGKPVGFKLCIGSKEEFHDLCKEMIRIEIYPDFITVDGGEGGTGAAPLEFTDSIGMPYKDGLAFVYNCLVGYDIKKHIKLVAAGKITSAFHLFRTFALGADACNAARSMMLALGCIQALECNINTCPTGVATQKKDLIAGLDVEDKTKRVFNYHHQTIEAFVEMLAAAGFKHPSEITRKHVYRRLNMTEYKRYEDIYGRVKVGEYLYGKDADD